MGMGGNVRNDNNRNCGNANNNDPYAKIKFTITSLRGKYDAKEYLDWHITVEQKFASHIVSNHHKLPVSLKILL